MALIGILFCGTVLWSIFDYRENISIKMLENKPKFIKHIYTLLIILVGWVFLNLKA